MDLTACHKAAGGENPEIAVGDVIFYKGYTGTDIDHEGKKYLMMPYADILGKLVETDSS